jgi:hypothetical protein
MPLSLTRDQQLRIAGESRYRDRLALLMRNGTRLDESTLKILANDSNKAIRSAAALRASDNQMRRRH